MRTRNHLMVAAACLLVLPCAGVGQQTGKTRPVPVQPTPCCAIASVDSATSIVTARETASGYTFKFKLTDRKLLLSLKVGDKIWADFNNKTVRLRKADAQACCAIIPPQPNPHDPATTE